MKWHLAVVMKMVEETVKLSDEDKKKLRVTLINFNGRVDVGFGGESPIGVVFHLLNQFKKRMDLAKGDPSQLHVAGIVELFMASIIVSSKVNEDCAMWIEDFKSLSELNHTLLLGNYYHKLATQEEKILISRYNGQGSLRRLKNLEMEHLNALKYNVQLSPQAVLEIIKEYCNLSELKEIRQQLTRVEYMDREEYLEEIELRIEAELREYYHERAQMEAAVEREEAVKTPASSRFIMEALVATTKVQLVESYPQIEAKEPAAKEKQKLDLIDGLNELVGRDTDLKLKARKQDIENQIRPIVSQATEIYELMEILDVLKTDRFAFLREEQNMFLKMFQSQGVTSTWGRIVDLIQNKAYIFYQKDKKNPALYQTIFQEQSGRISNRNDYGNQIEKKIGIA